MTNVLMPPTTQPTGTMVPGGLQTQFVTLRNEGDEVFSKPYGPRDRLIIPPGQQVTVVEEVAWQFLGRWWMDNNNKNRDRVHEYDRLRTLYGAYENEMEWERVKPQIVAYDGSGERITSVVDDPEGASGPQRQTTFSKQMSLEGQIAAMNERQEELQLQIARLLAAKDADQQPTPAADPPPQPQGMPLNPTTPTGPPMADLGAAGRVPVAPPAVQVPTMPDNPATVPGPPVMPPASTDGTVAYEEPALGDTYGTRLDVTPEPIPMPNDAQGSAPVDEPQKARIKGH